MIIYNKIITIAQCYPHLFLGKCISPYKAQVLIPQYKIYTNICKEQQKHQAFIWDVDYFLYKKITSIQLNKINQRFESTTS